MNAIRVLARPLLASVFIVDAVDALKRPDEHVEKLAPLEKALGAASRVVPGMPRNVRALVRLHAGVTLASGVLFAVGKAPRTTASILALAALPAAAVAHPVRTKEQREEHLPQLLGRAAALSGLFFAATDRKGAPSLGWRYHQWRDQRAQAGSDAAS